MLPIVLLARCCSKFSWNLPDFI